MSKHSEIIEAAQANIRKELDTAWKTALEWAAEGRKYIPNFVPPWDVAEEIVPLAQSSDAQFVPQIRSRKTLSEQIMDFVPEGFDNGVKYKAILGKFTPFSTAETIKSYLSSMVVNRRVITGFVLKRERADGETKSRFYKEKAQTEPAE